VEATRAATADEGHLELVVTYFGEAGGTTYSPRLPCSSWSSADDDDLPFPLNPGEPGSLSLSPRVPGSLLYVCVVRTEGVPAAQAVTETFRVLGVGSHSS
jgi:hypothetical protein